MAHTGKVSVGLSWMWFRAMFTLAGNTAKATRFTGLLDSCPRAAQASRRTIAHMLGRAPSHADGIVGAIDD